jgi:hypothetical protein
MIEKPRFWSNRCQKSFEDWGFLAEWLRFWFELGQTVLCDTEVMSA